MRLPNQQGQTIIEVLIAIVVMLTGMLGVLALAQNSINNERLGSDRLVATQLAREAIEQTRATRDTNFMSSLQAPATPPATSVGAVAWDKDLGVGNALGCGTLNDMTFSFSPAGSGSCPSVFSPSYQLNRDPVTFIYSHGSGSPTKFFRKLETQPVCLPATGPETVKNTCDLANETVIGMEVTAEVGWAHFNTQKNVVLTERLYNWR